MNADSTPTLGNGPAFIVRKIVRNFSSSTHLTVRLVALQDGIPSPVKIIPPPFPLQGCFPPKSCTFKKIFFYKIQYISDEH